ncbi:MAG: cupin domain-containing protein [Bacteroidales bacterium]
MQIQNLSNSPKVPFNLNAFILHSKKPVELVHILIKPDERLAEHQNPFDVIFFVIDGSGILSVDGQKHHLKSNDTIKIISSKMRDWENNTDSNLRLLVIKLL